jgi:hypothetical protein
MGKEGSISLPTSSHHGSLEPKNGNKWRKRVLATIGLSSLLLLWVSMTDGPIWDQDWMGSGPDSNYVSTSCHQAEPLLPKSFDPMTVVQGHEGRIRDWLSGAVKIPTEMFDVMGPIGEDKRWDIFYNFSTCTFSIPLEQMFPERARADTLYRLGRIVSQNP